MLELTDITLDCGRGGEVSEQQTRAAEGPAAEVHDRMPVVLPDDAQSAWIDPKQTDGEKALALAQEKAVTAVEHHPVATPVNNAKNQGAELIEPINLPA